MRSISLNNLLIIAFGILLLTVFSCSKTDNCEIINCNLGIQNVQSCLCECPDGVIGINCKQFDSTKIQILLNSGYTPFELYQKGILLDSLYGKKYGDGIIFYLDTTNGLGMVCPPRDVLTGPWGCYGLNIINLPDVTMFPTDPESLAGVRLFDGKLNTIAIGRDCNEIFNAANVCRAFLGDSLNEDWFLPSREELKYIFQNLKQNNHGVFNESFYWSSSEAGDFPAWVINFSDGSAGYVGKTNKYGIRPVRIFSSNCPGLICINGIVAQTECKCNCLTGFKGNKCTDLDPSNVQTLIDQWKFTPFQLFKNGIPLDSLYGKVYKGGLIFYLNTTDGSGLVAARQNTTMSTWGCSQMDITSLNNVTSPPVEPESEIGARIGDGERNTKAIIEECTQSNIAAKYCFDYSDSGFSDWFLPSREELKYIYLNLKSKGYGALDGTFYFSSTEQSSVGQWHIVMSSGSFSVGNKHGTANVRPVRKFN